MNKLYALLAVWGFAILFCLGVSAVIGAFLFPYVINTWLAFLGKTVVISHLTGAILGFIPGIGQTSIPLAIATFILMLFLI